MWSVVEFDDGVQLVPTSWTINNTTCYWPPFKSTMRFEKAVRSLETPDKEWPDFPLKNILGQYDNYEKAKSKLKLAEEQSDLNTDYDDETAKKKRKIRKQKIISSSDDSDLDEEIIEVEKQIKPFPNPLLKSKEAAKVFLQATKIRENNNVETGPKYVTSALPDKNFQDAVLRELQSIKMNMIKMQQKMETFQKCACKGQNTDISENNVNNNDITAEMELYPLTTEEDLEKLERKLSSNKELKSRLILHLSRIAGYTTCEIVKLILRRLFSDKLAANFSWLGAKKKKIFSNLLHSKIILEATRLSLGSRSCTEKEVIEAVKNWLRHATARARNNKETKENEHTEDDDDV